MKTLLIPAFLGCALLGFSASTKLAMRLDDAGLASLRMGAVDYLEHGDFRVNSVKFKTSAGAFTDGETQGKASVNKTQQELIYSLPWGMVQVQYRTAGNRLLVRVRTSNKSPHVLTSLSYELLGVHLPATPREYDGVTPILADNIGAPSVLSLTTADNKMTLCNDDVSKPLLIGFPWASDKPAKTKFPITITTGRNNMYPNSIPEIQRPIAAGAADQFTVSLRFSTAQTATKTIAADIFRNFSLRHPFRNRWTDHRPIGSLIIGTAAAGWDKNPRGWLLDANLDVTTAAGVQAFHERLLAWADRSIAVLRKMDAQGMITWDIEGEQFPHATTYIGDPRLTDRLAPEMAGVADAYFKRFRDAGLHVGVTIRPQQLSLWSDNRKAEQKQAADPAQVLIDKIGYARKRWGATLFYIDSNGDPNLPLSVEIMEKVSKTYPDVLLIPEHENIAYYSIAAPYDELRGKKPATPAKVVDVYSKAFSVINIADGDLKTYAEKLKTGMERGDILLFRGWYDDPLNAQAKKLRSAARFTPAK